LSGIYKITNKINGKFYIGLSNNIKRRFKFHRTPASRNSNPKYPLYAAILKYGLKNFDFSILEIVDDISLLNKREIFWIEKEKPAYNAKAGGNAPRGYKHSKEACFKISIGLKGKYIGEKSSFWGRKHTEETKHKQSEARKGIYIGENHPSYKRKPSDEERRKISEGLKGIKKTEEHKKNALESKIISQGKPINQYNKKGELIKKWRSIGEAVRELNLHKTSLINVCKKKKGFKTCGGFRWEYAIPQEPLK
jgi:group I intron endonuclease